MESGLSDADRVLAICTERYVQKANAGEGGVGYEKMILTAQLMRDLKSDRIVPVVRQSATTAPVPTFLSSRVYVDFRDEVLYESGYAELLRDIHGEQIRPRPPLGQNPFLEPGPDVVVPRLSFSSERYVSPAMSGTVTFDYSNNNGRYVVGAGDTAFETAWSRAGSTAIYVYSNPPSIRSVALALNVSRIEDIGDAALYDTSSQNRCPHLGEIVVWQNAAGYYLATKITRLQSRGHGDPLDELTFSYVIAPNKSAAF